MPVIKKIVLQYAHDLNLTPSRDLVIGMHIHMGVELLPDNDSRKEFANRIDKAIGLEVAKWELERNA